MVCSATTHTDLMLRAVALGIECQSIHNTSIFTAVACCGLQLYQFGQTYVRRVVQGCGCGCGAEWADGCVGHA
jgi:diphthamide biosynthesis methyltransferase